MVRYYVKGLAEDYLSYENFIDKFYDLREKLKSSLSHYSDLKSAESTHENKAYVKVTDFAGDSEQTEIYPQM